VATRTPDLYRVKVKQPLQDQQEWLQVVDSMFEGMGQIGPVVPSVGHNGPNFSQAAASTFMSELGKCVRHLRQRVRYTVEALASESGLPSEYLEAVEAGRVELSVRALVVICEALGLSGAILSARRATKSRAAHRNRCKHFQTASPHPAHHPKTPSAATRRRTPTSPGPDGLHCRPNDTEPPASCLLRTNVTGIFSAGWRTNSESAKIRS